MIKLRYVVYFLLATILVTGAGLAFNAFFKTESGTVTIHKRWGRVIAELPPGGPYLRIPVIDETVVMSTLTLDNKVVVKGRTSDQQELDVVVAVQWAIAPNSRTKVQNLDEQVSQTSPDAEDVLPGDASYIHVTYGTRANFDQAIMDRRIVQVTNSFISSKSLEETVQERDKVTKAIIAEVRNELKQYPIIITGIQVLDIIPSAEYTKAIEAKQIAEVNAEKAENEAAGIKTLADANNYKLKQTADAEAYSIQKKLEAEAEGITKRAEALAQAGDDFVEYQRVMQWDGVMPKVVGAGSGIEFGVGAQVGKDVAQNITK